jgi:ATP-binding cassette subfamily C protein CydC
VLKYFLLNAKGSYKKLLLSILLSSLTVLSSVGLMGVSAYLIILAGFHPSLAALQLSIVGVRFFGISRSVFRYLERLTSHHVNFEILGKIRITLFEDFSSNFSNILDRYSGSEIFSLIISDIERIENLFIRIISPWAVALITSILIGLFFGLYLFEILFIYLAGCFVSAFILPFLAVRKSINTKKKVEFAKGNLLLSIVNFYQFINEAIFYQAESKLIQDLGKKSKDLYSSQKINAVWEAIWNGLSFLSSQIIFLMILIAAALMVEQDKLEPIMLGVLSLVALSSFEAISNLSANSYQYQEIDASVRRLSEFHKFHREDMPFDTKDLLDLFPIRLENVHFIYEENKSRFGLRDINFEIKKGDKIAIIGPNGAGKSTLIEIIMGYRRDFSGEISYGGMNLKNLPDKVLRSQINYLSANPYFFNTTIRSNLLLAKKSANDGELIKVLQDVNLFNPLSVELDTTIEEMGKNFSSGELQRLAFAQLLLLDGDLLIFDEPFSNLDPVVTKKLFITIDQLFRNKTIILITHDYSQLFGFNKVLVMDNGNIINFTSKDEMNKKPFHFSQ